MRKFKISDFRERSLAQGMMFTSAQEAITFCSYLQSLKEQECLRLLSLEDLIELTSQFNPNLIYLFLEGRLDAQKSSNIVEVYYYSDFEFPEVKPTRQQRANNLKRFNAINREGKLKEFPNLPVIEGSVWKAHVWYPEDITSLVSDPKCDNWKESLCIPEGLVPSYDKALEKDDIVEVSMDRRVWKVMQIVTILENFCETPYVCAVEGYKKKGKYTIENYKYARSVRVNKPYTDWDESWKGRRVKDIQYKRRFTILGRDVIEPTILYIQRDSTGECTCKSLSELAKIVTWESGEFFGTSEPRD